MILPATINGGLEGATSHTRVQTTMRRLLAPIAFFLAMLLSPQAFAVLDASTIDSITSGDGDVTPGVDNGSSITGYRY